jgi:hypothetical protein
MGPFGILLHMRTIRDDFKADPTQIGRNLLISRDHLRGSPLYIGEIVSLRQEICGNSKGCVESEGAGQRLCKNMCSGSPNFPTAKLDS